MPFEINNKLKILIKITIDIFLIFLSLYIAIIINAERVLPISKSYLLLGLIICALQISILYFFKTYTEISKFFGYENIFTIIISLFIVCFLLALLSYYAIDNTKFIYRFLNTQILVIYSGIFIFLNILFKITARNILSYYTVTILSKDKKNYVIYGAGRTGLEISRFIKNFKSINTIYFVDDDKNKIGRTINGINVLSPKILEKDYKKIDLVLICIPSASSFEINSIIKNINNLNLNHKNISSLDNFLNEQTVNKFNKNINFDKSTVLSQDFSENIKKNFQNKKVLITGAAGTIGKELVFQISRLDISSLIALDFNELSLSKLKKDYKNLNLNKNIHASFHLLNLNNKGLLKNIIEKHKPDVIFHAAAYKHVDVVENNPIEAVTNNVMSLLNILECIKKEKNISFIFISTDKAVKPINYMGKSKRLGEIIVCSMNDISLSNNFSCVRFGNVIGSSGSLIPILNEQISNGGPITITDKNASRYFMTVQDAVNLTIQASDIPNRGLINVLNMGVAINIYELVKKILKDNNILVSDMGGKNSIKIDFIGLRPGEKLHEELYHEEKVQNSKNEKIIQEICDVRLDEDNFFQLKNDLDEANKKNDINILKNIFNNYLSN